jgi:hypothetical protein
MGEGKKVNFAQKQTKGTKGSGSGVPPLVAGERV